MNLRGLTVSALSLFLATSAFAATPPKVDRLAGKRLADKVLAASDAQRKSIPETAIAMGLRRHGMRRAALRADFLKAHNDHYTVELPQEAIRDQAQSGRCWIFATLNVIEKDAAAKNGGKVPKLSRAWIDAKNLQSTAYELIYSGATVSGLRSVVDNDIGEGGHFGWATQIVDEYGVVPEHVMRDFADSKSSAVAIKLLQTLVADAQDKLRTTDRNSPEAIAIVAKAHDDIDRAIARTFTGRDKLPETFVVGGKTYTPKEYAEALVGPQGTKYVTLEDYKAQRPGWRSLGSDIHRYRAYNTGDVQVMKDAVRAAIDAGHKVYVSAPVGSASAPYMSNAAAYAGLPAGKGIMSIAAHDYASLGLPSAITDRETIQRTGLNGANHAMTITGYELGKDGRVVKWKVENSWGKDAADQGIQHMYDDFFTSFVGVVTVPGSALPKAMLDQMNAETKAAGELGRAPTAQLTVAMDKE